MQEHQCISRLIFINHNVYFATLERCTTVQYKLLNVVRKVIFYVDEPFEEFMFNVQSKSEYSVLYAYFNFV